MACSSCFQVKVQFECSECQAAVCKKCVEYITPDQFPLLEDVPEALVTGHFCPPCFDKSVRPFVDNYQAQELAAQDFPYFSKAQTKETRLMSRAANPVKVSECRDRREAILKLAFKALAQNYNGMIDVEITSIKVRDHGRQSQRYSGQAIPAQLDLEAIARREERR